MTISNNLSKLQEAYRIWDESKGKASDVWLDIMSDEVCITTVDENQPGMSFAKDCRTKQGMVEYLSSLLTEWDMAHWTPGTFVEQGDLIAMFGKCAWTYKTTGKQAEVPVAHLWTFKDGRVVEFREVFDSASAAAAAIPD